MSKLFCYTVMLFVLLSMCNFSYAKSANDNIHVCAIAQMYDSLEELKAKYKNASNVEYTYGSATSLYNKISNNELKCDLYIGNDTKYTNRYVMSGKGDSASISVITEAGLVLWSITNIVDKDCKILTSKSFSRLAISDPRLQVSGYVAVEAMKKYGIDVQDIRANILFTPNEYQTLSFIQHGNAILGFLPYNIIKGNKILERGSWCFIPRNDHSPMYYYMMSFRNLKNSQAVNNFRTYLLSKNSQFVFHKHGFY